MVRAFFFLVGYVLAVYGGISTIAYLNLTTTGLSFLEYFQFISKKIECYLIVVGLVMIWISIYFPAKPPKKE
ncbi:hypothetical protein E1I69_12575 [Bacillus timonensis]|uniref:Uncharacterized protein n=1 Tax=Bacillus timonensis TaxID=1033734 RepID=A0A4S3PQR1_9BACI|nr:hypothetical protein E1I69_12575 [Bacillus timonensis]